MREDPLVEGVAGAARRFVREARGTKQIMKMARILPISRDEYMLTLSHCRKLPHRAVTGRKAAVCVALGLVLAWHGMAADESAAAGPPAARGVVAADTAAACARAATVRQRLNLSSGVYTEQAVASAPLSRELDTGVDQALYDECLRREGFDERAATSAYLERADACRTEHSRPVHLGRDGGGPRVGATLDETAYRACVAGAIEVEVRLPD